MGGRVMRSWHCALLVAASAVRAQAAGDGAPDGEWKVRITPSPSNTLKGTTAAYDDVITIRNGMLGTRVSSQYGFDPARCRVQTEGGKLVVVAELDDPKHGRNVYRLVIGTVAIAGTLEWGKTGEDGQPKSARFDIAGTRAAGTVPPPPATPPGRDASPPKAPVAAQPQSPSPEEAAAARRAFLSLRTSVISGVQAGKTWLILLDHDGEVVRGAVVAADERRIEVRTATVTATVAWDQLTPKEFYGLACSYTDDHAALADYCRGHGLLEEARLELAAARTAALARVRAAVIEAVRAGARPRSSFRIGNTTVQGTVTAADEKGIAVQSAMGSLSFGWTGLGDGDLLGLGRKCDIAPGILRAAEEAAPR